MKKIFIIPAFILLVCAGCGVESGQNNVDVTLLPGISDSPEPTIVSSVTSEPTVEVSVTPESTETAVVTPEPTVSATDKPKPTASATAKPKTFPDKYYGNKITIGSWLYYLDLKKPVDSPDSERPLYNIHRVKKDGTGDENLNILCFRFDLAGEYLYADTNITYGDCGHWFTYRYDLDGKGEKQIEYNDMKRFSKGDRLYFCLFDETAFYSATTACTDVEKYEIKIPDDEEIHEKLGYDYEIVFITITDVKDGWVCFEFKVTDTGPMPHYTGKYRMNLSSREIEKVDKGIYE